MSLDIMDKETKKIQKNRSLSEILPDLTDLWSIEWEKSRAGVRIPKIKISV